jgi:DNA-binding XRE family transcriptional regulator
MVRSGDVRYLRGKGDWSVQTFAKLLGVTPTTVYRWERADPQADLKVEALQASILSVLDQVSITIPRAAEIEKAVLSDGGLRGLYLLLSLHYTAPSKRQGAAQSDERPKMKTCVGEKTTHDQLSPAELGSAIITAS